MNQTVQLVVGVLGALVFASTTSPAAEHSARPTWIATWGASPQAASPDPDEPLLRIDGQTVRERVRVRVSVGGMQLGLRLSNEHGLTPLVVGSATVALPSDPARVKSGSLRSVTFGGRSSVTIPTGAPILSDPVDLTVERGSEISVSLFFPGRVATPTLHELALKRAIVSSHGDHAMADAIDL